jgi:hypothetical protein
MTKTSIFAKGALAAALAMGAVTSASAQSAPPVGGPDYNSQGYQGNYDPCRRDANNRGVTGALVGGAGGAVLGSQLAARGHRTDGSLLGGVVGAIAGAVVGHNSAACDNAPPPPPPIADAGPPPPPPGPPGPGYYQPGPPPPPPPGYAEGYGPPQPPPVAYAPGPAIWVYGHHGRRFRVVADRIGPDGCTLAASPVYLPDGRVDPRYVRVCPDYRGRYHIVD